VEVRSKKYEERNVEVDCADSDIDSDCTGNDAGSDVVYVEKKEGWAKSSTFLIKD